MEMKAQLAWGGRMALQWAGVALATRGIGDAALWEAVSGFIISLSGALWSYRARRKLSHP